MTPDYRFRWRTVAALVALIVAWVALVVTR